MIANKKIARYHSVVITEEVPCDLLEFEHSMEKLLNEYVASDSVYIHFDLGVGKSCGLIESGISILEEEFAEIGKNPFSINKLNHHDAGLVTIYFWKNPNYDILSRPVKKIDYVPTYGVMYF